MACLLAGGGSVWAITIVFSPPADVLDSTGFTTAEIVQGEVGASIDLITTAAWSPVLIGRNQAAGTVTRVTVTSGQEVTGGDVLYWVDERPVVIAPGPVPAYRSLAVGTAGSDVAQLQQLLTGMGFYHGVADGSFGWSTRQAVRAWQKSIGVAGDGVVGVGDVVFVPSLPTRIALDVDVVEVGAGLSGGEPVVSGLPPAPRFVLSVADSQSRMMPNGTRVEVTGPDGQNWEAFVVDRVEDAQEGSSVDIVLGRRDGSAVCGGDCGTIPVTGEALLRSRVVTVETVAGLVVPSAALVSQVDGSLAVIDETGVEHEVSVVASAHGMSVIEGVDAGLRVRLPAEASH
ncbi:peptidoglycan-binding domain-containing protein [Protaetiibacter intestinalis]|uniref:peptidoglycan-binding domain-containing protein n=1 Tax=Protaetiibacter intestinalis TaxID=2419774 RepID=UPI0014742E90|nr:peptidoglycan-binding domain-containing protein [Protaetiibacter intestinalis]